MLKITHTLDKWAACVILKGNKINEAVNSIPYQPIWLIFIVSITFVNISLFSKYKFILDQLKKIDVFQNLQMSTMSPSKFELVGIALSTKHIIGLFLLPHCAYPLT